jgi:hypothetical protein
VVFAKMMTSRNKRSNLIMVAGTVTFDQAKREAGAPVSGTVKMEVGSFRDGGLMHIVEVHCGIMVF